MKAALIFTGLLLGFSPLSFATPHHRLEISLAPALKHMTVVDGLSNLPTETTRFHLHKDLQVKVLTKGDQLRLLQTGTQNEYELKAPDRQATLQFSGVIFDPVSDGHSSGLISAEGVVLFGSSYWLPDFSDSATYEILTTLMPEDWKIASPLSQNQIPQKEIYLVAGPFQDYHLTTQGVDLKVFLRKPEPALAQTFLNLLPGYLDHYQKTLGGYPYKSFAVIENFWETGFGMPGFTLLGSGVVRLPVILNSSLPHELLHNWWGNSVYVDYQRGNWCEGLTNYLADHWQQELLGAGRDYRRQSLMNFQDYAKAASDFPLREFKERFNFSSQAVGYGKGMMFFHMLRNQLGESTFAQGLRDLYLAYRGQSISYEEIQESFEKTSGTSLKSFFNQWLDRRGAPSLKLSGVQQTVLPSGEFQVRFELSQLSSSIYDLLIPVRFTLADGRQVTTPFGFKAARENYHASFRQKVASLEVDPEMDVFRDLDRQERPVALSNIFGASKIWLVGSLDLQKAFLQSWQPSIEAPLNFADDKLLQDLPPEGAVVLLGDSPLYEKLMLENLKGQDFAITSEALTLFGASYSKQEHKTALVARSLSHPGLIITWIRGGNLETLAPRLLHYGKYGVLVFSEKSIPLKTTWPILQSPLKVIF